MPLGDSIILAPHRHLLLSPPTLSSTSLPHNLFNPFNPIYPEPKAFRSVTTHPHPGMAKKRKSVATRLDEVDRTMYSTFCSAANFLSQLYTHAMNQQKLSFQAGERHALEKLYQWILRQQEEGSRVTTIDIVAHLQNELEYGAEESPMSPRQPSHQQHSQTAMHTNLSSPIPSNAFATAVVGQQGTRTGQPDQQAKNSVFSNALSSPIRHSLQPYHLAQGQGGCLSSNIMSSGNGTRNGEMTYPNSHNRDTNPSNSGDCMDMHADSPGHDFSY